MRYSLFCWQFQCRIIASHFHFINYWRLFSVKKFYFALMAFTVFIISGCGGGSSGGSDPAVGRRKQISPDVKQVAVITSHALERNKRYRIYKGAALSGMNGARYYISNTGSEQVESTLNLGFSEELSANESFIITNYAPDSEPHSGSVVFAYDPSALNNTFTSGGNVAFTGGSLMHYRTLSLEENTSTAEGDTTGHYTIRPIDAEIYAQHESERGVTTFAMGSGTSLTFIADDEDSTTPRNIPSSGDILQLVRKVNTFSGIISR